MKRSIFAPVLLIGLGIIIGIFLISNITPDFVGSLLAKDKIEIGAPAAPATASNSAKIINDALSNASEAVLPTVVYIDVETEVSQDNQFQNEFHRFFGIPQGERRQRGSGSGVIVTTDGYIVTNNHVVANAVENGIKVTTIDKRIHNATLIGHDPLTDIAVLKIEGEGFQAAHFGNIEKLRIGEMAIAVGNPLGLNSTVTSGIISAIGRGNFGARKSSYAVENYIQTDAAINPGNSGGGLFDLNGSLIGINTAIATETGTYIGYGFAIPIDLVKAVVEDIIEDGEVNRGYIGISLRNMDASFAKGVGLDKIKGVMVQSVLADSPAAKAGIEEADVILMIDGKEVNSSSELQSVVATYRAGDEINLTLFRYGKTITKSITLKSRDSDDMVFKGIETPDEQKETEEAGPLKFEELGFEVAPLTDQIKNEYNIQSGALITDVQRYSVAADRGLFPNGVIVKADRQDVNSPAELKSILKNKHSGDVVMMQVKYQETNQLVAIEIP